MSTNKYHWKRDTKDTRDFKFTPKLNLASLPPRVDLRANCSPVEDQGNIGSCTGNAIASVIEYLYKIGRAHV